MSVALTGRHDGFTEAGLRRLREVLDRHVDSGKIPGLVALISRGDETHVEEIGTTRHDGGAPMRRDTIFRMASTSKPVSIAAAMVLLDECRLRLDDPVEPWLPSSRTVRCCGRSTARWTTRCRRAGRSPYGTCSPPPSGSAWT
ncbi:hypothetical protein GCM10009838_11860 [Catenulispora subtropica]|uniref:Beta-lactamase-related domain-containing protein n=1 Tax=Catenulispora subtropica TaxID=450798 RepID=A0ABN2QSU6_9ACTN